MLWIFYHKTGTNRYFIHAVRYGRHIKKEGRNLTALPSFNMIKVIVAKNAISLSLPEDVPVRMRNLPPFPPTLQE